MGAGLYVNFIRFCLEQGALSFGRFTLKSGRISPYFFNAGVFHTGEALSILGGYYARTLRAAAIDFDVLFGPAYKGIPLVSAAAMAFFLEYDQNVQYCFDRKEIKQHGESGRLVGAPLTGKRVVIIDDVMTAGTAVQHSIELIHDAGATLVGIVILLDRQERGVNDVSAVQYIQNQYRVPVFSVIQLADILHFVKQDTAWLSYREAVELYQKTYGVLL